MRRKMRNTIYTDLSFALLLLLVAALLADEGRPKDDAKVGRVHTIRLRLLHDTMQKLSNGYKK